MPGVAPGHVAIIGAGVVGTNALQMAVGTGARVTVLDKSLQTLRYLDDIFGTVDRLRANRARMARDCLRLAALIAAKTPTINAALFVAPDAAGSMP